MRSTVVIVFVFLVCFEASEGHLKFGDEGVCLKSSKPDRPRKHVSLKCCDGWQYSLINHKCEFFCRNDCGAGKCIGPNKCSCEPPNAMINNKCVKPICEPACINATCTGNNNCSCISNYERLNDTHCAPPCPPGYNRQITVGTDPAQCEPICDTACVNATCIGHNTCSCISGYEKINDTHCSPPCPTGYKRQTIHGTVLVGCEPVCDTACVNATCIGQNSCSCIPGYEKMNDTHCSPPCPTGYKRQIIHGTVSVGCEPVCDTACVNATCNGHNTCSCIPGYEKINNTHCASPCPTGYKRQTVFGTDLAHCEPICDSECSNGTCTGHNNCSCFLGYEKVNETYCAHPCPSGYKRQITVGSDPAQCEPICDSGCVNASCTDYNTCSCIHGYEKINGTHCAPPCPTGYKRLNTSRWQCDPICDSCQHGNCIAPYECLCDGGYTMKDGKCVPDCASCTDGICTAPGVCSSVLCKDCDGNCTEANVCSCRDKRPCFNPMGAESAEIASSPRLAGLELTWLVGGVIGLIILTSLIVILSHMWKRRKEYGKNTDTQGAYTGSVVYTVSNTLLHNRDDVRGDKEYDEDTDERNPNEVATESLLNNDDHETIEHKIAL